MLSAGCASGLCPFSPRFLKEKKEHRKPVRWYTRLIVYGNPGRVVNGYAPGIPVLICGFELVVYVVVCGGDGARPRSSPHPRMRPVRTFLRSYRGTHPLGRSALSLLRCGEHPRGYPDVASGRCTGTLRQRGQERLAEQLPGKRGRTRSVTCYPQRGKAVSSVVTSGCPKRSEGGCPCRNEDEYRFPCRAERRNEPSGLPPAKTCPSRPAHPEEHAGRRHHSSPRRARVRRLHAHRWRLRG